MVRPFLCREHYQLEVISAKNVWLHETNSDYLIEKPSYLIGAANKHDNNDTEQYKPSENIKNKGLTI